MIVYDIECKHSPVIDKKRPKYTYADGWEDYKGMGVAVVSVYDYMTGKISSYNGKSLKSRKFKDIFEKADIISGFNIKKYDNNMLRAIGIKVDDNKCYDILEQLWFACGLNGEFNRRTHGGFSLDKVLFTNFSGEQKMMNGKNAPFMWQDGKKKEVIDYCEDDVRLETMVLNKIFENGGLKNPKTKKFVRMALPHG